MSRGDGDWFMHVTTVGIVIAGRDGRIVRANRAAECMFGLAPGSLAGCLVEDLLPESLRETHRSHRKSFYASPSPRSIGTGRTLFARRADGSEFPVEVGLTPFQEAGSLLVAASIVDVSGRVAAERALRQAQKMETIGQLTGGIAHDFNNLLTVIEGNLQMIAETLGPADPNLALVQSAARATRRGSDLVRGLLSLSRGRILQPTDLDLAETCSRMLPMLERVLGERICITTKLQPDLWSVHVDPAHLESAILNLVVNARDAMPEGGQLTIEARNLLPEEVETTGHSAPPPGDYVALTISDTGCGMDVDTLSRIHEPFFTTKSAERGTGLGLPMVFAFARESGGLLDIVSRPGRGTASTLQLPRGGRLAPIIQPDTDPAENCRGGEPLLLVEDDEAVRGFASSFLRSLGYEVLATADGPTALGILAERPDIALLFTDFVLSGPLDGLAVATAARRLRADLPVLLTSGYPHTQAQLASTPLSNTRMLPKPYRCDALAREVRRMLDGRSPP